MQKFLPTVTPFTRLLLLRISALLCVLVSFSAPLLSPSLMRLAHAECVPTDDPCAPKKKLDVWDAAALVGFNLTQGNSDTILLNLGVKASVDEGEDLWDLGMSFGYGEDEDRNDPDTDKVSKNDFRANARYDHLLNDGLYLGGGTKFLFDEVADIDYRSNLDPTVGYFFLRDNSFKLRLEGGPSYVFEKVSGEENDYLSPRVANRFDWAISCTSKLFQQAEVLFDASDSNNYIVNAEIGVEAALSTDLALVILIRESFDNRPAEGKEKDDLAVISSLKILL